MTDRHRIRYTAAITAPLTALLLLTACTGGSGSPDADGTGPSVIAPGKPGEVAETLAPEEAKKAGRKQTQPNSADFTFMTMMIEHHKQALVMSELAEKHAEDGQVRKLADRIKAAQGPEIKAMRGWLKTNGADQREDGGEDGHDGHNGHDEGAMAGMATEKQLDRLRAARGADFDELFLTLMITHHQGAVTMSKQVLAKGNDVTVEEIATEIASQQTAEVNRMRKLR